MAERNYFIDTLKGIAIIFVLFIHHKWNQCVVFDKDILYWVFRTAVPIFMISTGYVFAMSSESKKQTLKDAYSWKQLSKKLIRYTMPVVWFYLFEALLVIISEHTGYFEHLANIGYPQTKITLLNFLGYFFIGGRGEHGTYYFPVIIQVTFLLPIIYHTVKKHKWGIWVIFFVNLAFELIKALGIPSAIWRVLAVRYIFAIAMGCYIYIWREKLGKWYKWLIFFLIGAGYIYLTNYTPHRLFIFNTWYGTAFPFVFYIAPIYLILITKFKNTRCRFLEELGKSSYHILLTQIIFYNYFSPLLRASTNNILGNNFVGMAISLAVCLPVGYGYYKLYNSVR